MLNFVLTDLIQFIAPLSAPNSIITFKLVPSISLPTNCYVLLAIVDGGIGDMYSSFHRTGFKPIVALE